MNEIRSLLECRQQAALVSLAGPGNVERGAMVDRGADDRQTDRDIHSGVDTKHFDGTVTLVMIHRDDDIEIAPAGPEKQGVRRQRSFDVPAAFPAGPHRRLDFRFFLAPSEKSVLAGVRIDTAHSDTRMRESRLVQGLLRSSDGAFDQTRLDPLDRIDETDVRGDVDDPESRSGQHH